MFFESKLLQGLSTKRVFYLFCINLNKKTEDTNPQANKCPPKLLIFYIFTSFRQNLL